MRAVPLTPPGAAEQLRLLERHPDRADELAPAAIAAGATTREVAAVLGVDQTTVARRWGAQARVGRRTRWDITDEEVLALHHQGWGHRRIAAELDCSRWLVFDRLRRHGLAGRKKS